MTPMSAYTGEIIFRKFSVTYRALAKIPIYSSKCICFFAPNIDQFMVSFYDVFQIFFTALYLVLCKDTKKHTAYFSNGHYVFAI